MGLSKGSPPNAPENFIVLNFKPHKNILALPLVVGFSLDAKNERKMK